MRQIDHKQIIREAASRVGGIVSLSLKLGLSRGALSQWSKIPDDYLLEVERITGVSRAELRPDLFAPPLPQPIPAAEADGGARKAEVA